MTFRVGQKVVCVDGYFEWLPSIGIKVPKQNAIYEIRDIISGNHVTKGARPGLLLQEIVNGCAANGIEYNFDPDRFRPIVERKTDIGFAQEILRKVSRKDRVSA